MAKVSPAQNVFEGELSPLAAGRTDIERYGRAMRYMLNTVACRTGPAVGRSGTYYEQKCMDPAYPSKLLAFEYSEEEAIILEFGHYKMRFHYEYNGIVAHREKTVTFINAAIPFTFTAPGHDVVIGEAVVFSGFASQRNVNSVVAIVTNVVGDVITTDYSANFLAEASLLTQQMAVVYEVVTPWSRDHVTSLRIVQELNVCYVFCRKGENEYMPHLLSRYDTFDWRIAVMDLRDGPFMDINITNTYFTPLSNGSWVPNMTSNTAPTGVAAASTEVVSHEAWKAFDGDIDTFWEGNESQEGWLEYSFEATFVNILPNFTSPTSGAMTISASSEGASNQAWKAGDLDGETDWRSSGTLPQWWQIDLGAAQTVRVYTIRASRTKEEYAPRDWTLSGSATGIGAWTVLDTRTGVDWTSGKKKDYTVQSPASFRYYRIDVTKVNRKTITDTIAGSGKKGKKNYVPETTVTTKSDNKAGFAQVKMSVGVGLPRVVNGYTIYLGKKSKAKATKDHAPRSWEFEGWDGNNWKLLDSRQNFEDWPQYRSEYFDIQNDEAYLKYRIRIKECYEEGDINPRIGCLAMSSPDAPPLVIQATSREGVNDGLGFLVTDIGRQIRLKDQDNTWRWGTITAISSEVNITVSVSGSDPLVFGKQIKFWRLGLWSDTTGWPHCGTLHEDRLFAAGAHGFPDHVCASRTGQHTNFEHVGNDEVVLDDHGLVLRCNSIYMSHIKWLKASEEALRVGTGKNEFVLSTPSDEALNARNAKIRQTTRRGSANHEPAVVDTDVIFIQTSGRAIYANTYSLGNSGAAAAYTSTLMSKLGAHLLEPKVVQIVYQQEPHSIIWGRREDGSVVAMTYSNDDDVFGGHRHEFGGANVKDLCAIASPTDRQDSLWLVAMRNVSGVDVHYIERLFRFWDYGDILQEDATYVDSALRYYGQDLVDKVYGLRHLEGKYLNVLADNIPYALLGPVTNGMLQLERPAYNIVCGLPMVIEGEIIAPDVGAEDGTSQGKSKRPHSVVLSLWESARGEVGRWDEDHGTLVWTPVEYNYPQDANVPEVTLRTGMTSTTVLPGGYGTLGTVRFRQTQPLPFNVVAIYPQMYVEDER